MKRVVLASTFIGVLMFSTGAAIADPGDPLVPGSVANSGLDPCIIAAQVISNDDDGDMGMTALKVIGETWGPAALDQAIDWALSDDHGFFLSIQWRCRGHKIAWSQGGHRTDASRVWDNLNHKLDWSLNGHSLYASDQWDDDHSYLWSHDGHTQVVSEEWEDDDHVYEWTRDNHEHFQSTEWNHNHHAYQWSRDGHQTNLSQSWDDDDHAYNLSRGDLGLTYGGDSLSDATEGWIEYVAATR